MTSMTSGNRTALAGAIIILSINTNLPLARAAQTCQEGNALECYTQALVKLQAAQDALGRIKAVEDAASQTQVDIKSINEKITSMAKLGKVNILNSPTDSSNSAGGNSASADLILGKYETKVLVLVTAWGNSSYNGATSNEGIILQIKRDNEVLSQHTSFEASAGSMKFFSSTSAFFELDANQGATLRATVDPYGQGGNSNTNVNLTVFAIESN
jgi:hypothetical protein